MTGNLELTPARTARPPRRHGGWHITGIVLGSLMLLPGLGMVAGGTTLSIAQAAATDDDGYFTFSPDRLASDGVAVTSNPLWFEEIDDDATPWVLDWVDLDLRLRADSTLTSDNLFVGVARTADVEGYLAGTRHSVVDELDNRAPVYVEQYGERRPGDPLDQDFWVATATGGDELTWEARSGRWSVVVMNADGAPNVAADIEVGAKSGAVTPIAVTMLIFGGLLTIGSIIMIVIGARGRRTFVTPQATWPPLDPSPLPAPAPDAAVQLDSDVRQPTSVS